MKFVLCWDLRKKYKFLLVLNKCSDIQLFFLQLEKSMGRDNCSKNLWSFLFSSFIVKLLEHRIFVLSYHVSCGKSSKYFKNYKSNCVISFTSIWSCSNRSLCILLTGLSFKVLIFNTKKLPSITTGYAKISVLQLQKDKQYCRNCEKKKETKTCLENY